jgi:hypothetical protein
MNIRSAGVVLLALALTAVAAPGNAQQPEIAVAGRVLGPDNAPLADQRVVLHRVDAAGGATIAEIESDADGAFVMSAPATSDTAAVYFLAARYGGELYIGPPFRAGDADLLRQVVQVGVPGTSATALLEGEPTGSPIAMGRPATPRTWLLLLIPLLGVAALALYMLVPRSRVPPQRALLIRIAELDERMATAPQAQRAGLAQERAQLLGQLRTG